MADMEVTSGAAEELAALAAAKAAPPAAETETSTQAPDPAPTAPEPSFTQAQLNDIVGQRVNETKAALAQQLEAQRLAHEAQMAEWMAAVEARAKAAQETQQDPYAGLDPENAKALKQIEAVVARSYEKKTAALTQMLAPLARKAEVDGYFAKKVNVPADLKAWVVAQYEAAKARGQEVTIDAVYRHYLAEYAERQFANPTPVPISSATSAPAAKPVAPGSIMTGGGNGAVRTVGLGNAVDPIASMSAKDAWAFMKKEAQRAG